LQKAAKEAPRFAATDANVMLKRQLKEVSADLAFVTAVFTAVVVLFVFGKTLLMEEINAFWFGVIGLLLCWLVTPYIFLASLVNNARSKAAEISGFLLSVAICIFGLVGLIQTLFFLPSNQAISLPFVLFFIPLWQFAGLVIASLLLYFLNKKQTITRK
jgi:hypothetical protein